MKKLIDDTRLIFKCCSLYYEDGLSQQEICDFMGISRPSVSRMLKLGKDQGIVRIEVFNPHNLTYGKMERELERKYGLKEAIVVDTSHIESGIEKVSNRMGEEALHYLSRILENGDIVGVSMGMTLQNVARAKAELYEKIKCTFVPIVGGVSQTRIDIHSNYIASQFAKIFGGDAIQFFSPAVFSNAETLQGFLNEQSVKNIFEYYERMHTVILGIGIPQRGGSTLISSGYIEEELLERFLDNGVVGDVSLQFFNIKGDISPFKEFNQRVAGMPVTKLKSIKNRVGISGGKEKAEAVLGAINGGFINILITDVDCAEILIENVVS